jgi:prepilin-type processing-associated H-X9-DG protein
LFRNSVVRLSDVSDGTSHTLAAGERPPSPDSQFGWWYGGGGQAGTGSLDSVLGVRELNVAVQVAAGCGRGPFAFAPGKVDGPCDIFHYWSLHAGGANFLMCDGSVRFLSYDSDSLLPALATRARGDSVD